MSSVEARTLGLEMIIHSDPGKRGLQGIWDDLTASHRLSELNTLFASASSLFTHCKKALVATGFVIPSVQKPETDGPPGALAICRALHLLGREVSLITAPGNVPLMKALLEHESSVFGHKFPLIEAPLFKDIEDSDTWATEAMRGYDHLISIEILGAASDGGYYNMRGIESSALNAPIDVMWNVARRGGQVVTISIGDGGNEIGMGNLYDLVKKHVPQGETTGCKVECDHLITAGVSNWGGYALACVLYMKAKERSEEVSAVSEKMLPSVKAESEILDVMLANGAVDGPTCSVERKVDSLEYEYHEGIIERMLEETKK